MALYFFMFFLISWRTIRRTQKHAIRPILICHRGTNAHPGEWLLCAASTGRCRSLVPRCAKKITRACDMKRQTSVLTWDHSFLILNAIYIFSVVVVIARASPHLSKRFLWPWSRKWGQCSEVTKFYHKIKMFGVLRMSCYLLILKLCKRQQGIRP